MILIAYLYYFLLLLYYRTKLIIIILLLFLQKIDILPARSSFIMSRETYTKAVIGGSVTPAMILKQTKGGSLGGSLGNLMTRGGSLKIPGFSPGAKTNAQVIAMPITPLKSSSSPLENKNASSGGLPFKLPNITLPEIKLPSLGIKSSTTIPNVAETGVTALGIGGDYGKTGGNMGYEQIGAAIGQAVGNIQWGDVVSSITGKKSSSGKGKHRRGAAYWRNKYEAMYWKAKYESARYGHGRFK
jgi:hypothetical protein